MTQNGVNDLYEYLSAAWPLVIKPGVDPSWKRTKMRELYRTYGEYTDDQVFRAFQKWTQEHEKFPTTKDIINEIKWAVVKERVQGRENEEYFEAMRIYPDGTEYAVEYNGRITWRRSDFVNLPFNKEHLQPEEWERRYKIERSRILKKLWEEKRA